MGVLLSVAEWQWIEDKKIICYILSHMALILKEILASSEYLGGISESHCHSEMFAHPHLFMLFNYN